MRQQQVFTQKSFIPNENYESLGVYHEQLKLSKGNNYSEIGASDGYDSRKIYGIVESLDIRLSNG